MKTGEIIKQDGHEMDLGWTCMEFGCTWDEFGDGLEMEFGWIWDGLVIYSSFFAHECLFWSWDGAPMEQQWKACEPQYTTCGQNSKHPK